MTDDIVRGPTMRPSLAQAVPALPGKPQVGMHELLAFTIAGECYALPLTAIQEILKVPPVTEVPRAPRDILGIISVRGRVTTVLDLRRRLGMHERPVTKHSRVLLVDDGDEIFGVLVDSVLSVYRLLPEEVELAAAIAGDTAEYVRGIGRPKAGRAFGRSPMGRAGLESEDDIIILLDAASLLRSHRSS